MSRALVIAAVGLFGVGCYWPEREHEYVNEIDVYWQFSRHVVGGQPVAYDCAQAAVDYVTITDEYGRNVGQETFDCSLSSTDGTLVQAVAFRDFTPGKSYTFVVTGYRNNVSVPLFQGQQTITYSGGANRVDVTVAGIPEDLDLFAYLYNTTTGSPVLYANCSDAGTDLLTYSVYDHQGTVVASSNNVGCNGNLPVQFFAGTLDRDSYTVRVNGYSPNNDLFFDSCESSAYHYTSQIGSGGVAVGLYYPLPQCS